MQLSREDASLFFKLMPALQTFANQRLKIIKGLKDVEGYKTISNRERVELRNSVYESPEIIDDFVRENPFSFSEDELEIISNWKNFIADSFFIVQLTKKHAIFMRDDDVYAVLALLQPLQDILGEIRLPVYVKTVLLPFKGRIIYDGLLEGHNISFGPGISTSVKNRYRMAKQKGEIIESLDPDWKPAPAKQKKKDWKPLLDELNEKASTLRSSSSEPLMVGPAFSLAKAGLEFARVAVEFPEDLEKLDKALDKVIRASNKAEKTMYYLD
ncbi:MAG: hypothetical protein JW963_00685 [Anaerolineales bacterium]|nr:hypothetical protein [Anaerolineales bacterium]